MPLNTFNQQAISETTADPSLRFEALAKTYPHDNGVRVTLDLARWLVKKLQLLELPVPPILEKVLRTAVFDSAV